MAGCSVSRPYLQEERRANDKTLTVKLVSIKVFLEASPNNLDL